jgi:uncharacterized protein YbjQ (UPF0145 family)
VRPFTGRRGTDAAATRRAEESLRSIEAGGLPVAAQQRMASLRAAGSPYTSDLSTAEFLLVRQAGFRPVSQVMGSCVYHLGRQYMPGQRAPGSFTPDGQTTAGSRYARGFEYDSFARRVYQRATFGQVFELDTHTQAWSDARARALGRLAQEARLAGAHMVVGVKLERRTYDWGRNLIEFVAIGTALASVRYALGDDPVLASLSGQEFAQLYANGYWPAGIVAGTAVIYVMTGSQQKQAHRRFAPNQELKDYTQGVQHARKVAVGRVSQAARALDASGLVGLDLDVTQQEHEHERSRSRNQKDMVVTVHALGTAIVGLDRDHDAPPTSTVLRLNGEG